PVTIATNLTLFSLADPRESRGKILTPSQVESVIGTTSVLTFAQEKTFTIQPNETVQVQGTYESTIPGYLPGIVVDILSVDTTNIAIQGSVGIPIITSLSESQANLIKTELDIKNSFSIFGINTGDTHTLKTTISHTANTLIRPQGIIYARDGETTLQNISLT